MKFKVRFADKIVGFSIAAALISLVVVIFFLGSKQRWFSKDYYYKTFAASASGLSENMPVIYRGVRIGNVKTFHLADDDRVEVIFTIYDKYVNRARQGSLIEILVSPVGLGSLFQFYPGLGTEQLEENDLVPVVNSPEGKDLLSRGLGFIPAQDDSITILIARANTVLDDIHKTLDTVNIALGSGDNSTVLGKTVGDISTAADSLPSIMQQIDQMAKDISVTTAQLASPDGLAGILDGNGAVLTGLESSMTSVAAMLNDLQRTTAYLPREMPQIINLLMEVQVTLQTAQDVLIALRNNPLLRNGIPEHAETENSGTSPRNIRF